MKKFMMFTLIAVFSVAVLCAGGAKKVEALMITLSDDGFTTSTTVSDGGTGFANYTGIIGTFTTNVVSGISYPILGTSNFPRLDLHSLNVTSTAGGTLSLALTQTGFNTFGTGITGIENMFGGTSDGLVDFTFLLGTDNDLDWTNGDVIIASSTGNTGSFSDTLQGVIASMPLGDFSLTILATITHTAGDQATSFDALMQPVPEPGTIALLGIGLAGLVGVGVRRRAKKNAA